MKLQRSVIRDQLHVFALAGIAIAYPTYAFLLANPAYLVANRITSGYLYIIIALTSFLIPAIIIGLAVMFFVLMRGFYSAYHRLVIWGLLTLIFMPLISPLDILPFWLVLAISIFLAIIVTSEYVNNQFTYAGFLLLVPLAFGLPIYFALDANIRQVLMPEASESLVWRVEEGSALPPVLMIVYDELPLVHLLDVDGGIDKTRFPAFASLAEEGTWYANATTVHDQTIKAVPAMLTGHYPQRGRVLPVPANYPGSLFEILRGEYSIHAIESLTALSRESDDAIVLQPVDAETVATDMIIFYLRSLLPKKAADAWLPLQNGIWGGFLTQANLREWLSNNAGWRQGERALNRRFDMAIDFIEQIPFFPRNTFHYFHIALPHRPYGFLPSGRQYKYPIREDKFNLRNMTQGELDQGRAAHILQLGLADTLLGMFREKLKDLGYWEDALVVVVADHGQSYRRGRNNRLVTQESFGNVAFVPLFIKYPGQETGGSDESNVQTIDIAPSILDALNIVDPPIVDGRSLLDGEEFAPSTKMVLSESGSEFEFDRAAYQKARFQGHQEAVRFFSLSDARSDLYNFGPGLEYLGKKDGELAEFRLEGEVLLDNSEQYHSVDLQAKYLPLFVRGQVLSDTELDLHNMVVAILVNGVVRAVASPYRSLDGDVVFHKILAEDVLQANNKIAALLLVWNPATVSAVSIIP
ncbi:MAG: sulfatase-like hydrolase/transferase [Halioglobus sp.]|nr:sulfatase-like hydrolase/transferase [Halioglobus sp.]